MAITPNTTCDIYRTGNAPPATPDVAAVPCYIVFCYDQGRERGEKEPQQFRFVARMLVAPDLDVRDDFNDWLGQATTQDTVYIPDKNGLAYSVAFVERNNRGGPADAKCVYLDRKSINWPWPGAPGQPGAILPPPTPPAPPGGDLQLEAGMGLSRPISGLSAAGTLDGTELAILVQAGADVKAALSSLAGFALSGGPYLPLAGGTMAGNIQLKTTTFQDGTPALDSLNQLYGWTAAGPFVFMDNASTVTGSNSFHVGLQNSIAGDYATIVGNLNASTSGNQVFIFGGSNSNSGQDNNIFGLANTLNAVSGGNSTIVGTSNTATMDYSFIAGWNNNSLTQVSVGNNTIIGQNITFSADYSVNIGCDSNMIGGQYCTALGFACAIFSATGATALGYQAQTSVNYTVNLGGAIIIQNSTSSGASGDDCIWAYSGAEVVLFSDEIDLTATGTQTVHLPTGCTFSPSEVGLVITQLAVLSVQPYVQFGDELAVDDLFTAAITTNLTAVGTYQKFRAYNGLNNENAHIVVSATVQTGAAATMLRGRFYWKGILLQNQ